MSKSSSARPSWDDYFLMLAKLAATRSTCLSRPTGAVIVLDRQVLATGYNGSMPGATHCLDEEECYRRKIRGYDEDNKYDVCRAIHAEANALAQAAVGYDLAPIALAALGELFAYGCLAPGKSARQDVR